MADLNGEDLELLGSRIAMLVSEPGEADNAGRAVATLARRLGLTGGQLKDFVITGAMRGQPASRRSGGPALGELANELAELRHSLRLSETQARNAALERDALRAVNSDLRDALDRARTTGQVRQYIGLTALAAAVVAVVLVLVGPDLRSLPNGPQRPAERPEGSPFTSQGLVHRGGTSLLKAPETGAEVLAQLQAGARVQVRQVLWRTMVQWLEVEVTGQVGYVLSTDIDRS